MKIKTGDPIVSDDFWYDLTDGGYIKPKKLLANKEDIKRVKDTIPVIWLQINFLNKIRRIFSRYSK